MPNRSLTALIIIFAGLWLVYQNYFSVSHEFVGTIISIQDNVLAVKGLPADRDKDMLAGQEVSVEILPDTNILKQYADEPGTVKTKKVTLEDLQADARSWFILARVFSRGNFYKQTYVTVDEIIYTIQTGLPGGLEQ